MTMEASSERFDKSSSARFDPHHATSWEIARLDFEERLDYIDGNMRMRATSLLFVGSLCGLLGFSFAGFLGYWRQFTEVPRTNFRNETMQHFYFPATVSEMVDDPTSAEGKVFFAFVVTGAICMLTSWYSWSLRNVYIGDDTIVFKGWLGVDRSGRPRGVALMMLRQFLPPVGMMMVACIRAPPQANRTFTDIVSCCIHTLGAVMAIGGYAFIELYTLVWDKNVVFDTKIHNARMRCPERLVRGILIGLCLFSILGFQTCGVILNKGEKMFDICCNDVWATPTEADNALLKEKGLYGQVVINEIAQFNHKKMLVQTASGAFLGAKLGSYWFEVFSGLFMLASHMAIWFYCPERHVDLCERLPDPDGHDGHYHRMGSA